MTFLVLAIVCSTLNHLLFKRFARDNIDLLSAIVANYVVCVCIGFSASVDSGFILVMFSQTWFPLSVIQGAGFVLCFFLIGQTTKKLGVASASLATRLSVAIPTAAAFLLYDDLATGIKITGILIAMISLYLSSLDSIPAATHSSEKKSLLPLILFLAFGAHTTLIKFVQERFLGETSFHIYVMAAFLSALIVSGLILLGKILRNQTAFKLKNFGWGLVLGGANYGAVFFLIQTLGIPGWQSSQVFPTISIAVLVFSALGARIFFRESIHRYKTFALVLGSLSIIFINI